MTVPVKCARRDYPVLSAAVRENGLHSDVQLGHIERLKHDPCRVLAVLWCVERGLGEQESVFSGSARRYLNMYRCQIFSMLSQCSMRPWLMG